jgi:NADH:ubiquinone reductase (H+-translocating)
MSSKRPQIIILGAGIGGLRCALELAEYHRHQADITLVDKEPFHTFHARLFEVAASHTPSRGAAFSLTEITRHYRDIRYVHDLVTAINSFKQTVTLNQQGELRFDYLVIALGSVPNDSFITGLHDYAITLTTLNDSLHFRRTLKRFNRLPHKPRVIIGGAGPSGVELASAVRTYPNPTFQHKDASMSIIEACNQVLPGFSHTASRLAKTRLERLGIEVYTGQRISRVSKNSVTLEDGRKLPFDLLIWTGGCKPNPLIQRADLPISKDGRITVNRFLQVRGFSRIYAIGDNAHYSQHRRALAPVAPVAFREGNHAAHNILREITHRPLRPYRSTAFPVFITFGPHLAMVIAGPFVGIGSWVVKLRELVEWYYLSTFLKPTAALKAVQTASSRA